MRALTTALILATLLVGCANSRGHASSAEGAPSAQRENEAAGSPLSIRLSGVNEARYNPAALGLSAEHIALSVTNPSSADVDMSAFRVWFTAKREGVRFPCADRLVARAEEREPKILRAKESFRYEREIPCMLSLPGIYNIEVSVSLDSSARRFSVGTFSLNLIGSQKNDPRPHPAAPGLYGAVMGNPFSRPMPPHSSAKYTAVVALVNASPSPIYDLSGAVVFRVYKVGQSIPCMESPVPLHLPRVLPSGETFTESVPVSCVLDALGDYDVVGSLDAAAGGEPKSAELGRYRLTITNDPLLFTPPPH